MSVAEPPKCSNCFYDLPFYEEGRCPHCGHYEKIDISAIQPKPLAPDEAIISFSWLRGVFLSPEQMDKKEQFIIRAGNQSTKIGPPYYSGAFRLHRNRNYTITIESTYNEKVLHKSEFDLKINNTESVSVYLERKTILIRRLFQEKFVNIMELDRIEGNYDVSIYEDMDDYDIDEEIDDEEDILNVDKAETAQEEISTSKGDCFAKTHEISHR